MPLAPSSGSVSSMATTLSDEPSVDAGGLPITNDPRVRTTVATRLAWAIGAAGLVWGTIYLLLDLPGASLYPYAFSAFTALNFFVYNRMGRFGLFAAAEIFAVLVVPAALAIHLGGLGASGAVGTWSLLAPIGALMALGSRFAIWTFAGFVVLTGLSVWADGTYVPSETLGSGAHGAFLVLNVTGVSLVAFWVIATFMSENGRLVAEQLRLRQIEKDYVAQEAMLRQQERLATLGKMSAGVAHELNNPAAAAGRATHQLGSVVDRLVECANSMAQLGVGSAGIDSLWSMVDPDPSSDPIDVSDREESLAAWLQSRSVAEPWELAAQLATLGFDSKVLNLAAEHQKERQLVAALRWIANVSVAQSLLGEVRTSSGRISEVVGALKGYSHMDAADSGDVDLVSGIEDTMVILKSQLSGIAVGKSFDPTTPKVPGNPGELNQVWTNLMANAAEALNGEGTIEVSTVAGDYSVQVIVADDGPGIPSDLVDRIFDPFVTTKAPGEGTGLGLNLTHQIVVGRHGGSIRVESVPGSTRFIVELPRGDS